MSDDKEYIEIKPIIGERIYVQKKQVVGYCHFPEHRGSITKTTLKSHDCLKKECHFLEKYEDNPYWAAIERIKVRKQQKKETLKQLKADEQEKVENWIFTAQTIADSLGYNIKVVDVKKVPKRKVYILFYISEYRINDWYKYIDLAKEFGKIVGVWVELRHAKNIDGKYAII